MHMGMYKRPTKLVYMENITQYETHTELDLTKAGPIRQ